MADIEYSETYVIYGTDKGVRFLTNPVSIKIMDFLDSEKLTVSEIAEKLDLSKSSIQSNMMKLSRFSLVSSYDDDVDKRKVIYYKSCIEVARSANIDEYSTMMEARIINEALENPDKAGHCLYLISYVPLSMGLNINPLIQRFGMVVAQSIVDNCESITYEGLTEFIRNRMLEYSPAPTELIIEDGSFVLKQKIDEKIKLEAHVFNYMMMGAVKHLAYKMSHTRNYVSEEWEENGFHHTRLKSIPGYSEEMVPMMASREDRDDWSYSIYVVNGKSMIFGNTTQIKILGALTEGMFSLKQLSQSLDIPSVTVHVNLVKLLEIGAISANDERGTKFTRYRLEAVPLLVPAVKDSESGNDIKDIVLHCSMHLDSYSGDVLSYVDNSLRMTGVDPRGLLYKVGRDFADIIVERNKNIEAEDYLKMICAVSPDNCFNVDAVSLIPLRLKIKCNMESMMDIEYVKRFYVGIIEAGLEKILDVHYSVSFVE